MQAVNDALIELRVADRLLREAQGLPIGDTSMSSRVASDPAGVQVPALAGSADSTPLVWPPEWQR